MNDLLVIGSGLAGVTAALEAKRRGAHVIMASRSWGATAMSTGALDIAFSPALSPAQQLPRTVAEHIMDIIAHRPRHPYGVLGVERTVAGLRQGMSVIAPALAAQDLALAPLDLEADNRGLPSTLGAVLPAASALASHWDADFYVPQSAPFGIVQFNGSAAFDAPRLAEGVACDAQAASGTLPQLVVLPVPMDGRVPAAVLARSLEDVNVLDELARSLAPQVRGLAGVLLPPVLGLEKHAFVWRRLGEALGVPVIEMLGHIPSVPGLRLALALEAALVAAGIENVGAVSAPIIERDRVVGLATAKGNEVRADAFVLASGRFIAGGVHWTNACREAIFDLPVVTEHGELAADSFESMVRPLPGESHPLLTAGVLVDRELRPMREGRPAYRNLFAAGMVVGGFASRYALCADGVALATGALAAAGALGDVAIGSKP